MFSYSSPRTLPAVGVIISEGRIIDGLVRIRKREARALFKEIKKRSIGKYNHPTYSEIKHLVRRINSWKNFSLKKVWRFILEYIYLLI